MSIIKCIFVQVKFTGEIVGRNIHVFLLVEPGHLINAGSMIFLTT